MPMQPPDDSSWVAIGPKAVLAAISVVGTAVGAGLYRFLGIKATAAVQLQEITAKANQARDDAAQRAREQEDALETARTARLTAEITDVRAQLQAFEKRLATLAADNQKGWDLARGQRRDYEDVAKDFNRMVLLLGKLVKGTITHEAAGMIADQFTTIALPMPPLEDARRLSGDKK